MEPPGVIRLSRRGVRRVDMGPTGGLGWGQERRGWLGEGGHIVELDQSLPGQSWDDLCLGFFWAHFDLGLVKK